jgi:hypothetical protein
MTLNQERKRTNLYRTDDSTMTVVDTVPEMTGMTHTITTKDTITADLVPLTAGKNTMITIEQITEIKPTDTDTSAKVNMTAHMGEERTIEPDYQQANNRTAMIVEKRNDMTARMGRKLTEMTAEPDYQYMADREMIILHKSPVLARPLCRHKTMRFSTVTRRLGFQCRILLTVLITSLRHFITDVTLKALSFSVVQLIIPVTKPINYRKKSSDLQLP